MELTRLSAGTLAPRAATRRVYSLSTATKVLLWSAKYRLVESICVIMFQRARSASGVVFTRGSARTCMVRLRVVPRAISSIV